MIFTALTTALAVTCDSSDDLCTTLNQTIGLINQSAGRTLVHEGAAARLRPQAVYDDLASARDALVDGGCLLPGTSVNRHVGVYNTRLGTFTGRRNDTLPIIGTIEDGTFAYTPPPTGGAGGFHADRKIVGFYNGFERLPAVGRWIRNSGRNGAFVSINVRCNGTHRPDQALAGWAQEPPPPGLWDPTLPGNREIGLPGTGLISTGFIRPFRRSQVVCTSADPAVLQIVGDPVVATLDHFGNLYLQVTIAEGETGEIHCGFGSDVADATHPVATVTYAELDTGLPPL